MSEPQPGDVGALIKELVELGYDHNLKAIACAVIDEQGIIRCRWAYHDGLRFNLLGAVALMPADQIIEAREKGKQP